MAILTRSVVLRSNTDAEFRAWATFISDAFTTAGWVQTADTGQINLTTVTAPGAINTKQGYQIRRMDDVLQGTASIFMRIDFGSGAATDRPSIWIRFGTGSDGAGALTPGGGLSSERQVQTQSSSATAATCWASGDTGRINLALGVSGQVLNILWISIERTKDQAGADTNDGLYVVCGQGNSTSWYQEYYQRGVTPSLSQTKAGMLFPTFAHFSDGTKIGLAPNVVSKGIWNNPCLGIIGAFAANVTLDQPVSVLIYGAYHRYYPCHNTYLSGFQPGTVANGVCLLMRYE